jgi:UDPglucose 6-dehydrogenase
MARSLGTRADLAETTHQANCALAEKMAERLRPLVDRGITVAVLGLAYKPHSHVVEQSQAIALVKALLSAGARVVAYDPLAGDMARQELHGHAVILPSIRDCLTQAQAVLITSPDPEFSALSAADFNCRHAHVTVVDFWRILDKKLAGHPNVTYIPIGRSVDDVANAARLARLWAAPVSQTA